MHRLTASRFGLAELCTGFLALEHDDTPSKAAKSGTDKHALIERYLNGGKVECDATWWLRWREWWDTQTQIHRPLVEVSYSIDPQTLAVEKLGYSMERDYSQASTGTWCGTADLVNMGRDVITVIDWKTGGYYPYYPAQLDLLAYCALMSDRYALAALRVQVADVFVTDDGVAPVKWRALALPAIAAIERRIKATHAKPITQNVGAHCDTYWCPARKACPSYQRKNNEQTTEKTAMTFVKGIIKKGRKIVVHGPPGVGKTGFAASAPGVVFLDGENGTDQLDVGRFPITKWEDVEIALKEIETNPELKDTKVVAIDTISWLAQLHTEFIMKSEGKTVGNFFNFGANKKIEPRYWRELLERLDTFRERGISIIILCHSEVKNFKNPEGEDFDRYQLQLPEVAANLIQQWADYMLFATWETFTEKDERGRMKGIFGARKLYTERTAAYDAKHRGNLQTVIDYPEGKGWQAFIAAVRAGAPVATTTPANTTNEIKEAS